VLEREKQEGPRRKLGVRDVDAASPHGYPVVEGSDEIGHRHLARTAAEKVDRTRLPSARQVRPGTELMVNDSRQRDPGARRPNPVLQTLLMTPHSVRRNKCRILKTTGMQRATNTCTGRQHRHDRVPDHAQKELGDVVSSSCRRSAPSPKRATSWEASSRQPPRCFVPVQEVIEINEALADNPALVNTDPWGDGWMVRIKPADTEVDELMTAEEYDEYPRRKLAFVELK
jgi:glycine cleavage system H protein